jgi:hypothetical protein
MACMVLRLDPRFPLLWRTPQSLQFGLDRPSVVLETVSHADELVIAALVTGVSRSGAEMIGYSAGLDEVTLTALLHRLDPALERPAQRHTPASAARSCLTWCAVSPVPVTTAEGVSVLSDETDANPEIAVIVAHYVVEPEDHGRWLRRDIPHLGVVYGDRSVSIGPIIRPGTGPCLYCLELHHTEADPAWPAMASQLWHRRSGLESTLVVQEVATTVARLVLAPGMVHRIEPLTTIEIDAATGERRLRVWLSHPECGCGALTA